VPDDTLQEAIPSPGTTRQRTAETLDDLGFPHGALGERSITQ